LASVVLSVRHGNARDRNQNERRRGPIIGRKSASSFKKSRLQSEVADSLRSPTGRTRSNGRIVYKPAKHDEELTQEVTDNLPDIVPVTQKEMEVIETYLAVIVEKE
jgi:hypothetical protein